MNIAMKAMLFAREKHKGQLRKYTGNPYFDHLAEVAGIAASVISEVRAVNFFEDILAIAWMHDVIEDTDAKVGELYDLGFSQLTIDGVVWLSDIEDGNRETRKRLSRERLAQSPWWVQTIKVADLISNTASIIKHDPEFSRVYLEEKRLLLDVLTLSHPDLLKIAREQIND